MTTNQLRFIRLHQRYLVERVQEIFQGAMVRATSNHGVSATVRLDELEDLIGSGVMAVGWGGSFYLTEQGRAL